MIYENIFLHPLEDGKQNTDKVLHPETSVNNVVGLREELDKKADQTALDTTNATLSDTKSKVDNFFSEAGVEGVIDTLNEIVEYIGKDEQGAIDLAGQVANNSSQIEAVKSKNNEQDAVINQVSSSLENYVDVSTPQNVTGKKTFIGGLALNDTSPEFVDMPYFLGIEAFGAGGTVRWVSRAMASVGHADIAGSVAWENVVGAPINEINDLQTRLTQLESRVVSVYSGNAAPTSGLGADGDIYLETE